MERSIMATDNKTKTVKKRAQDRTSNVEESNKESTEGNKPKTGLEDPRWRRRWSLVFKRMK